MQRTFDVMAVREQFPALARTHDGRKVAYFDGPGGSQVARSSIDAVSGYMSRGGANLHGPFPTSVETGEILRDTRRAVADFLGAEPDEIAFVADGHFYASTLAEKLGIADKGGWVRAGLAPYNTEEEVEGFIELLVRFTRRA